MPNNNNSYSMAGFPETNQLFPINNGNPRRSIYTSHMTGENNYSRFSNPKKNQLMGYIPRPANLPTPLPQRPRVMSSYVPPSNETKQVQKLLKEINYINHRTRNIRLSANNSTLAARDPRLGSLHSLVGHKKNGHKKKITKTKKRKTTSKNIPNPPKINIVIQQPTSSPEKNGVLRNRRRHGKTKSNPKRKRKQKTE